MVWTGFVNKNLYVFFQTLVLVRIPLSDFDSVLGSRLGPGIYTSQAPQIILTPKCEKHTWFGPNVAY